MTAEMNRYADFDGLRQQAVALRREGLSLRQIRDRLKIYNNDLLHRLVKGEPPPEWTKRPNAKDDLRARARELRLQGMTYDQIQVELGCSKSSISLWVRDLPKVDHRTPAEQGREAALKRWAHEGPIREAARTAAVRVAGAEAYWADLAGVPIDRLQKTTLKKHNPKTVRKNTGSEYRGCLIIRVAAGSRLYRRIEGSWYGIVEAAKSTD
ncbi:acylphosphatase [Streptomyces litmocidini]|uniref:hypothetical protein n=1 Tax=Streptomyces litmocidini TaxID=67318 RepID=UPI0036F8AD89